MTEYTKFIARTYRSPEPFTAAEVETDEASRLSSPSKYETEGCIQLKLRSRYKRIRAVPRYVPNAACSLAVGKEFRRFTRFTDATLLRARLHQ